MISIPMKYCPTCQQRYSRAHRFCRTDGSKLLLDPYRHDNQDRNTQPTLEMPDELQHETQQQTVELEKDGLSDLEPFGEADCESELKVLGSSEYSKYYFDHTQFNSEALSPKVFLIIGRRGAGKTALSQFFSFQQLMPKVTTIEVDEPAALATDVQDGRERPALARLQSPDWSRSGNSLSGRPFSGSSRTGTAESRQRSSLRTKPIRCPHSFGKC